MAEVSFGEWLKRRRNALGLTQEQLARQINCSTSALRKFEAELRRPSADVLEGLAEVFNIPPEERKSFLRFARGDWQAISGGDQEDAPWHTSPDRLTKQVETSPPRNNLPLQLTSFIGREKDQVEIINLLAGHRLVTLVGAGGIGKTRLSLEVAREALNTFSDGLWFIELAPLSDPALVPQAVMNTLGLIEQANRPPQTVLTDFLKAKKSCLILDNCEHLIQACAQLAEALLRTCPALHILATSREALGISGESTFNVAPLSTPDIRQSSTTESLTQFEAVELFLERAQTAVSGFTLTQDNSLTITQICHQLDGIPLAIELAAARLRGLSIDQIAARLDDRFHLLTSGARTVLPRHQTLQALIDWSHELLTKSEQTLLRRLSVFAGGWTLEAAEAVCTGDGLESNQILDLLLRLVDKSLVIAKTQGTDSRYHMLETVHQYAREKLWQAEEGELLRQRHLSYFVDLAERAEPNLRAFDMIMWLNRLEIELDNIRAALEYALESDVEAELWLASALLWFWHIRGHKNEGIEWLERGLSVEAAERGNQPLIASRAMIRGKALNASGFLMTMFVDPKKAQVHFEESLALFQGFGSAGKRGVAYALWGLAGAAPSADNRRRKLVEQSLRLFRELGDKFGAAECLTRLSGLAQEEKDYQQSILFAEEQLALRKEISDPDGIANALLYLGDSVFRQNDYQRAIRLLEESVAIFRELGNKWATGLTLSTYGDVYSWQGDYKRAIEVYEEAFAFAQDLGDRFLIARSVYNLGVMAWFQGDYVQATSKIMQGLTVFRETGEDWLVASSLHCLGDIALATDDDKSAVQWYEAEMTFGQEAALSISLAFALCGLGKVAWVQGNEKLATQRFEEGLKLGQEANLKTAMFHALYGLGRVTQSQGDYSGAHAYYREMLGMQKQRICPPAWYGLITYGSAIAYPLEALAVLGAAQDQLERATRLFSAAEILYPPFRFEMSAKERAEHDQAIATARAALGEEAFSAAWEEGKQMPLEEVIEFALGGMEANVG